MIAKFSPIRKYLYSTISIYENVFDFLSSPDCLISYFGQSDNFKIELFI